MSSADPPPPPRRTPPAEVAAAPLHWNAAPVAGAVVDLDGEAAYRIENVDRMDPFFVTVVSAADHWLFASSTGALSAGRRSPDHALFPYETVDKIHDAQGRTGGKTLLLVSRERRGAAALGAVLRSLRGTLPRPPEPHQASRATGSPSRRRTTTSG